MKKKRNKNKDFLCIKYESIILLLLLRIKNWTLIEHIQEVIFGEFPYGFLEKLQDNRLLMVPRRPWPALQNRIASHQRKKLLPQRFFRHSVVNHLW